MRSGSPPDSGRSRNGSNGAACARACRSRSCPPSSTPTRRRRSSRICSAACRRSLAASARYGFFRPASETGTGSPEFLIGATPEMLFDVEGRPAAVDDGGGRARAAPAASAVSLDGQRQGPRRAPEPSSTTCSGSWRSGDGRWRRAVEVRSFGELEHLAVDIRLDADRALDFEAVARRLHPTPALGVYPRCQEGADWLAGIDPHGERKRFGAPFGLRWPSGDGRCARGDPQPAVPRRPARDLGGMRRRAAEPLRRGMAGSAGQDAGREGAVGRLTRQPGARRRPSSNGCAAPASARSASVRAAATRRSSRCSTALPAGLRRDPVVLRRAQRRLLRAWDARAATAGPVAVVTTSGTAAAELLPAMVEAHYSSAPIVAVTADRPRAYRRSGAPQAIEQVGLFGVYAAPSVDLESPRGDATCSIVGGPAHVNVCFAEPLLAGWQVDAGPRRRRGARARAAAAPRRRRQRPVDGSGPGRARSWPDARAPLVIVGGLAGEGDRHAALASFCQATRRAGRGRGQLRASVRALGVGCSCGRATRRRSAAFEHQRVRLGHPHRRRAVVPDLARSRRRRWPVPVLSISRKPWRGPDTGRCTCRCRTGSACCRCPAGRGPGVAADPRRARRCSSGTAG